MMKTLSQLLFALCAVLFPLFVYAQEDTLNADGLFPKYNRPTYRMSEYEWQNIDKILSGELQPSTPVDSDMIRGAFQRAARIMELDYKVPPQYIISERFGLREPPINPLELHRSVNNLITTQWIHEDGECILFIKCNGDRPQIGLKEPRPDKSLHEIPKPVYTWARQVFGEGLFLDKMSDRDIEELKKRIDIWPEEEAEEVFNAHYVLTYPVKNKKAVYMGKYTHKMNMVIIKWGDRMTVSFLVTKKGKRHLDRYIEDVKGAFRFKD